jgi:hypothetical protein
LVGSLGSLGTVGPQSGSEVARQRGIEWSGGLQALFILLAQPGASVNGAYPYTQLLPLRLSPNQPNPGAKSGRRLPFPRNPTRFLPFRSKQRERETRLDSTNLKMLMLVLVLMQPTCSRHSSTYPDLSYGTALSVQRHLKRAPRSIQTLR